MRNDKHNKCIDENELPNTNEMSNESNEEDDIQSIAKTIMNNESNLFSSIHSSKSIKMLVKQSCDSLSVPLNVIAEEENREPMGEIKMNPPITIIHTQDDGARLRETKSLNKLPFKNRNPAL